MEAWRRKLRDYHVPGRGVGYDGCQVTGTSVQAHASIQAHRRALKNNMEYCARTRDPPNADESGGESATEDNDGM